MLEIKNVFWVEADSINIQQKFFTDTLRCSMKKSRNKTGNFQEDITWEYFRDQQNKYREHMEL